MSSVHAVRFPTHMAAIVGSLDQIFDASQCNLLSTVAMIKIHGRPKCSLQEHG